MRSKFINNLIFDKSMIKGEKGQVTIFIIIAVVIVVGAILFFALTDVGGNIVDNIVGRGGGEFDIEYEFSNCVLDNEVIDSELKSILFNGGEKDPSFFYLHEGNKYNYLCYTNEFYKPCVNQKPLLLQSIEKELDEVLSPIVEECLSSLEKKLKDNGFETKKVNSDVIFDITEGNINIKMDTQLSVKKGDSSRTIDGFEIKKPTEIYQLIIVGNSIVEFESNYGDSEIAAYMSVYPNTRVEKLKQGEGTTLYEISDRVTEERFHFASRSYALPAGYGL